MQIKTLREEGFLIKDICAQFNLKPGLVGYHLSKFGLTAEKMPDWSEEEDEKLRLFVNTGKSLQSFADSIGRTFQAANIRMHVLGIKNDYRNVIYSYNESFWDVPNPINCALAGFIAADGCISMTGCSPTLVVSLSRIDDGYLKMMAHFMGSNSPIKYSVNNGNKMASLRFCCHKWVEPLADIYGIVPAKTWKLKMPNIPSHLMDHYFKGFSDGDGHWGIPNSGRSNRRYLNYSVIGAVPDIVEAICARLNDFSQAKGKVSMFRTKNGLYRACKTGLGAVEIAKVWYDLKSPSLWRKHDLIYNFIKERPHYGPNIISPREHYDSLGYQYEP